MQSSSLKRRRRPRGCRRRRCSRIIRDDHFCGKTSSSSVISMMILMMIRRRRRTRRRPRRASSLGEAVRIIAAHDDNRRRHDDRARFLLVFFLLVSFEEFSCVVVFHSNVFSQRAIIMFKVSKKVFETLKRREGEKELIQKDTHQKPPHIFYNTCLLSEETFVWKGERRGRRRRIIVGGFLCRRLLFLGGWGETKSFELWD